MRFAVSIPNFGAGLGARGVGDLAALAERAGWDGFFLWDHLFAFPPGPVDAVDPWVALTVAATRTSAIRLGTAVTPLPRRRPLVLARQTASLDVLSGGRLVLGVGSGSMPFEWDWCGEEPDARVRGDMLDEGLALLTALWTGRPVTFTGRHYRVAGGEDWGAIMHPPPAQTPRVPVWVAGTWPGGRPFRRAARWDGVIPMRSDGRWDVADTAAVAAAVRRARDPAAVGAFDVAVPGETDPADGCDPGRVAAHADAGATWWMEAVHPWRFGYEDGGRWPAEAMRDRVASGPPRSG